MWRSLHCFAGHGPLKAEGFAACCEAIGLGVDERDVKQDPVHHDMELPENSEPLCEDCEAGIYRYGHFGPPCTTFTPMLVLSKSVKRSRQEPWGLAGLSAKHQADVDASNLHLDLVNEAGRGILDSGGDITVESIADYGDVDGPCYWPARRKMCPIALTPQMAALIDYGDLRPVHVPLCHFVVGGPRKWLTIWASPRAYAILAPLNLLRCTHEPHEHGPSIGRSADGTPYAELTACYPLGLNQWLAKVPDQLCRRAADAAGREIAWGATLHPAVRRAVEAQRRRPPGYASPRKLEPIAADARWREPMPTPHDVPPEVSGEHPDVSWAVLEVGPDDERRSMWPPGAARPPRPPHGIPGAPEGPITYEMIWRRLPEAGNRRVGYDRILRWRGMAIVAAERMADNLPYDSPGTLVIDNDLKEPWARPWLLDTRDPLNVVRARRSTRDTIFDGVRQVSRPEIRKMADDTGWREIDHDIVDQTGEGGLESRSFCGRHSVFQWHASGVNEHYGTANAIAVTELRDAWLLGAFALPPFEPSRTISHNVIMQPRTRPDPEAADGFERYTKPRSLTNLSGGPDDGNSGVLRADRAVRMPSAQTHGAGCAVAAALGAPAGLRCDQLMIDLSSAYCFFLTQRTEWWMQLAFWCVTFGDGSRLTGWFIHPRLVFGGAHGPNRFGRFSRMKRAAAIRRHRLFDAEAPLPAKVQTVLRERAALQRTGLLPPGTDQLAAGYLQAFLDDETGGGLTDSVPMPSYLNTTDPSAPRYIDVPAFLRSTAESGARPSPPGSRIVVYCCLCIDTALTLELEVADKTMCGDGLVILGLLCDVLADRLSVPATKSIVMRAEITDLRRQLAASPAVLDREMVQRNVGRLNYISQVDPSVTYMIQAGYAIAESTTLPTQRRGRHRPRYITVRADRRTGRQFALMLENSAVALTLDNGTPLLFVLAFPDLHTAGTLTIQSDASGDDGVGGFAFFAGCPREAWIAADAWPPDILEAIQHTALTRRDRLARTPRPECSMPACELFGPLAVLITLMIATDISPAAVVAILDCKPAASAATSGKSSSHLMRDLARSMRSRVDLWLGVHVFREFNTDADFLSHPASVGEVVSAARAAGITCHHLGIHEEAWNCLRLAIAAAFEP